MLTTVEKNYSQLKKEELAVVCAVDKLHNNMADILYSNQIISLRYTYVFCQQPHQGSSVPCSDAPHANTNCLEQS